MEKHQHLLIGCLSYLFVEPQNLEAILEEFPEIFEDEVSFLIDQEVSRFETEPDYMAAQIDPAHRPDYLHRFKLRQSLLTYIRQFGIPKAIAFQNHLLETLPAQLVELVGLDELSALKTYLQQNEVLLQVDETILVLDKMIRVHAEEHPVWKKRADTVRKLLIACHKEGIEAAIKRTESDKIEEMVQLLIKFAFAPSWNESQQMVEQNPDLFSPNADFFMTFLIKKAETDNDQNLFVRLSEHQKILRNCITHGIEATFNEAIQATRDRRAVRRSDETAKENLNTLIEQLHAAHANGQFSDAIELAIELIEQAKKINGDILPATLIWMGRIYLEWYEAEPDAPANQLGSARLRLEEAWSTLSFLDTDDDKLLKQKYDCASMLSKVHFFSEREDKREQYQQVVSWNRSALKYAREQRDIALTQHHLAVGLTHLVNLVPDTAVAPLSEEAIGMLENAASYFKQTGTLRFYAECILMQAGMLMLKNGEGAVEAFRLASEKLEEALVIFAEKGIYNNWYDCHLNLMQIYGSDKMDDNPDAMQIAREHFLIATGVAEEKGHAEQWMRFYLKFGEILKGKADYPGAIQIYKDALSKSLENPHAGRLGHIHEELCEMYFFWFMQSNMPEHCALCIDHGEDACHLMPNKKPLFIRYFLGLAYSFSTQGGFQENRERAILHLTEFVNRFENDSNHNTKQVLVGAYDTLANRLIERDAGDRAENLEQAIYCAQKGLIITAPKDFPQPYANLHNTLGIAYLHRVKGDRSANIEQCIVHASAALEIRTRLNESVAQSMTNLANGYMHREVGAQAENLQKATDLFKQALQMFDPKKQPKDWAGVVNNLGAISAMQEKYSDAVQYYQQVLQVYTREAYPERWVITRNNLVSAESHRCDPSGYQPLIDMLIENLSALETGRDDKERQRHFENIANLSMQKGDYAVAHTYFKEVFKIHDIRLAAAYSDVGKRHELESIGIHYSKDAYCLLRMEDFLGAFQQFELGKNHLLRENFMFLDADTFLEQKDDTFTQIAADLASLKAEQFMPLNTPGRRSERVLNQLLQEATNSLHTKLGQKSPKFNLFELPHFDLACLIPEGGALVFPMLHRHGISIFILTEKHPAPGEGTMLELGAQTVDGLIENISGEALSTKAAVKQMTKAQRIDLLCEHLWRIFVGPIYEKLLLLGAKKESQIVVFPHEIMNGLPIAAAWRMDNGEKRALLDDFSVVISPSLHSYFIALQRLKTLEKVPLSYLGIANPTLDLFFTEKECNTVAQLFQAKGMKHRLVAGKHATRDALIADIKDYSHVHFACHGDFNSDNTFLSGLVLYQQVLFSIKDIYANGLLNQTRLVTLSACNTGAIDLKQASETLGLPGAMLQAGVPAVVATLWAVDDYATMLLIEQFYKVLVEEELPPAIALRKAQIWLKNLSRPAVEAQLFRLIPDSAHNFRGMIMTEMEDVLADDKPFNAAFYWGAFVCFGA